MISSVINAQCGQRLAMQNYYVNTFRSSRRKRRKRWNETKHFTWIWESSVKSSSNKYNNNTNSNAKSINSINFTLLITVWVWNLKFLKWKRWEKYLNKQQNEKIKKYYFSSRVQRQEHLVFAHLICGTAMKGTNLRAIQSVIVHTFIIIYDSSSPSPIITYVNIKECHMCMKYAYLFYSFNHL